jgi:hypothetical protein
MKEWKFPKGWNTKHLVTRIPLQDRAAVKADIQKIYYASSSMEACDRTRAVRIDWHTTYPELGDALQMLEKHLEILSPKDFVKTTKVPDPGKLPSRNEGPALPYGKLPK